MANFRYLKLEYSEVFIFDQFMVKQIYEGEMVDQRHLKELKKLINDYFKDKPFAYLTNRVHSYTVDPLLLKDMAEIENLLGIGIIAKPGIAESNASFEKGFSTLPFEIFSTLAEACAWVDKLVKNN